MKLVISQKLAICLGLTHGLKLAGIVATVLLTVAHFLNPSIVWEYPVMLASATAAAALLHSILIDRAKKEFFTAMKNLHH